MKPADRTRALMRCQDLNLEYGGESGFHPDFIRIRRIIALHPQDSSFSEIHYRTLVGIDGETRKFFVNTAAEALVMASKRRF